MYAKVLLWCFGTLMMSLVAFVAISLYLSSRVLQNQGPLLRVGLYLLDECRTTLRTSGQPALAALIKRQQEKTGIRLMFVDEDGRDVVSGEWKRPQPANETYPGDFVVTAAETGQPYRLVMIVPPPPFRISMFLPYYVLILTAVAGLLWLLAVNIGSPLTQLARVVDRFGAGDLDARVEASTERRDEIGDLGRTFNQMAARLQTLLNAERQLLQDISHELRSPLVRLSFAAELTRTADDRDLAVDRMTVEIERLSSLVAGLLDVTRAEGDFSERNLRVVQLDALMHELADSCEIEAEAKRCRFHRQLNQRIELQADPELLRRAIGNVLSNAVRYAPADSVIDVEAMAVEGKSARISVRDRGPGVPADTLRRIFTPFYRVDAARDTETGGVGLGLAIAQRAVLLHHGQVSAENAGPGLRLTIILPISPI